MGKPIEDLYVEPFDFPYSFLVEAEGPDRDYAEVFPEVTPENYPHFVDLTIYETGWCSCRDFRYNVEPYVFWNLVHRRHCVHIVAAVRYLALVGSIKPKPTISPKLLFL